jgi:hypothetical protein
VLETADFGGAGILSGTGNDDAEVIGVAFIVELSAAAEDDVTLIGSGAGDDEAGRVIRGAFCVFFRAARYERRTLVGAGGRCSDALSTGIAYCLLGAAADEGIAFVRSLCRDDDAGSEVRGTDGMLITADEGRAIIGPASGHFDALILRIAGHVSNRAAVIDERITEICSGTRDSDAGGEVGSAFIVRKTLSIRGAFICAKAGYRSADFVGTNGVFVETIIVSDAFVVGISKSNEALLTIADKMTAIRNTIESTLTFIITFS